MSCTGHGREITSRGEYEDKRNVHLTLFIQNFRFVTYITDIIPLIHACSKLDKCLQTLSKPAPHSGAGIVL